jgi:ribA/ribD-fused uncharacterized protein
MMSDAQYLVALQKQVQQGKRFKYLCFWGHTAKQSNIVDKSCLSQWFPASFEVDGHIYKNTEQYMMAQKAKLFDDHEIFSKILLTGNPKEIKALGRLVKNYQDDQWKQHRFDIVVKGNLAKFSQNKAMGQFLLNTRDKVLVEASPFDKIWGIGVAEQDHTAEKPILWQGLNLLGFALMEVRKQL